MSLMKNVHFTEHSWAEVRELITSADKELAQIIDDWNPGKEYTFLELTYPFGSHILDINKGGFQIPKMSGETIPLTHPDVPAVLQTKLGYNSLPLGVVIQGGAEVYHKLNDRVFSLAYFGKGFNLGIWETFAPPAPYSVVAGARSLIMGPKIADKEHYKKLKIQFGLRPSVPRTLFDQWEVFVELAKHLKNPWEVKILFLNNKWLEPKPKNIGWLNFYSYLQKKAWQHTEYARSKSVFEATWKEFCDILQKKGERFDPYLIETARHVVFMRQGMLPAFAAIGKEEFHGPTRFLAEVYTDVYGLKNYIPTMLAPIHYGKTFEQPRPVYYSFQNPTLLDLVPKIKTFSSAVDDMRNLKILMEYFIEESSNGSLKYPDAVSFNDVNISYFHSEMHTYGGILPTSELPKNDPNLMYMPGDKGQRTFADTGSFFRCCLRLSPKSL